MNILWSQPNGGLALTSVFMEVESLEDYAAILKTQGGIPDDWEIAAYNVDWKPTGWRHEAHRWNGKKIVVDFAAAQEETKVRLRAEREPLFAKNDLALRDAMLSSDSAATTAATDERDRLRNITASVDSAKTLDELKALAA